MGKFQSKVLQALEQNAKGTGTEGNGVHRLEENWCERVIRAPNIDVAEEEIMSTYFYNKFRSLY